MLIIEMENRRLGRRWIVGIRGTRQCMDLILGI
jgi:hypothetical protein